MGQKKINFSIKQLNFIGLCKKNVIGRQCERCKDTYWNHSSGNGCIECNCDPVGSIK